ncbi:MAG TPA: tetratricopeptide repeat protein [Anaerolineales bacterium]|nr:tetratricopeptide repeat protein [Anaerolineales bacterium]
MSTVDWPDFNDLWDYNDPAGTERKFRSLLPDAEKSGGSYQLQLLTQIARTLGLQKKFPEAHQLLDEVQEKMAGGDVVEVRYLLERGRTLNSSGQPELAVPLFKQAVEIGRRIGADFYVVDALHMLGIAAPAEEQLDWNFQAIKYAEGSPDERAKRWMGSLYNNAGWTLYDQKRYVEALDLFKKAQAFREAQGGEEGIRIARWCVAKTLRVMGQPQQALAMQRQLETTGKSDGFIEEEIAECLYALGEIAESKPYFRTAYEALSQIDWVAEDAQRLERLKSLAD